MLWHVCTVIVDYRCAYIYNIFKDYIVIFKNKIYVIVFIKTVVYKNLKVK